MFDNNLFLKVVVCFLISFLEVKASEDHSPLVEISKGKIQGKILTSRNGQKYNAFQGIRYGKIKERFEIAEEPEQWDGIYNATEFREQCVQFDTKTRRVIGAEDCLFLNIYTPQISPKEKFPVIFWIHGGGFIEGTSNYYSANYFMDEPVVLITFNYRLGIFGFLDTQDGVVVGNLGLRDQILALEFVHRTIYKFGGDSTKISLVGSSAGAASVALHMLTNTSRLFQRAISQSSTALSGWLIQRNPKENAQQLAKFVNCPTHSSFEMVDCLKSKTSTEILNGMLQFKLGSTASDVSFLFTPSIESPLSQNRYLTDCPEQLMYKNVQHHDWMVGWMVNDGIFNIGSVLEKQYLIPEIIANWTEIAPWLFVYNFDVDEFKANEISAKILKQFNTTNTNGEIDTDNFFNKLSELVGDRWEVSGTVKSIEILGSKTKVYPFIFSYNDANFSFTNDAFGLKRYHDELQFLFDGIYGSPSYNDENSEVTKFSQNLVKLWVEFARTGVPSTTRFKGWTPIEKDKPIHFYEIVDPKKNPKLIKMDDDFKRRMKFWDETLPPSCRFNPSSSDGNIHVEL